MERSKYLKRFGLLQDRKDLFKLHGGRLLIEIIPPEEIKTAGGLITASASGYVKGSTADSARGTLAVVLLTGEGYYDTDGNDVPVAFSPGNIIICNDFGLKTYSTLPGLNDYTANTIALIDESLVQMSWENSTYYEEYCNLLK